MPQSSTPRVVTLSPFVQPSTLSDTGFSGFTLCSICHDTIKDGSVYCQLCSSQCNIMENWEGARAGIKRSADQMLQKSSTKYKKIDVGSSVIVEIPKVDRGPLDHKNVVSKVLNFANNLYQVGTSSGVIDRWLARNCIEFTPFVFTGNIPDLTSSLREIAAKSSDHGGQGFKKVSCRSQCTTNRCQCQKNKLKCNCHASHSCSNH